MASDVRDPAHSPPSRKGSLDWWMRDRRGHQTAAQPPNPALALWLLTVVLGWIASFAGAASRTLDILHLVGRGALLAWALDEVVRGASPFRRVLGGVVMVVAVFGLVSGRSG